MKKITSFFLATCIALPLFAQAKGKISIPDLKGYVTLKCDFHTHSVFSDGRVWPTVRIDEAFREGLDAIAITDHIEYRRWIKDIETLAGVSLKNLSHNTSYEIVRSYAKENGIMLIRGGEVGRGMPPGHINAIFMSNNDELDKSDYRDALRAAKSQNAFIFWNHPGWDVQQPDTTLWWPEHTQLLEQGMMHGVEVVGNSVTPTYYPEAHRWCLEKRLTMIGSSDSHQPRFFAPGEHRTMTLVFAKERTTESIREALNERRTAVYFKEYIIGEEKYLKELFENAVEINVRKTNEKTAQITFKNNSELTFRLKKTNHDPRLEYFRAYTIVPNGVHTITVQLTKGIKEGDVNFMVENFLVQPNTGMRYTLVIQQ